MSRRWPSITRPAVAVGGDQQRHADAVLGDRRAELCRQIQIGADVARVRGQPVDRDHSPGARRVGGIIHTRHARLRTRLLYRGCRSVGVGC